ncbi:MAG TPA: hypothetical protein VFY17_07845 [Pilimelia sp.]|nr:hypothetical protein [Pilimelia sp.]
MPSIAMLCTVAVCATGAAAPPDPAAAVAAALPGSDAAEVRADLRAAAAATGRSLAATAEKALREIQQDRARGDAEARAAASGTDTAEAAKAGAPGGAAAAPGGAAARGGVGLFGDSQGDQRLVRARQVGDAYYTPSRTGGVDHGHVGLYTAVDQITEITAGRRVYTIPYHGRWVQRRSALFEVRASTAARVGAAAWALSRVGVDPYSYNFATNRITGHLGAKNCSKLVWSAYRATAGLDLDANGGLGVYPRDVRDAAQSTTYRLIGG